jgi:hypothetical protein
MYLEPSILRGLNLHIVGCLATTPTPSSCCDSHIYPSTRLPHPPTPGPPAKDPDPVTGLYTAKLGDFGLSCAVSAGRLQRTQSGSVLFVPRPNSWDQMAMAPSSSSGSDLTGPRE